MKIIILGLGNPILTDDSVGIKVARQLQAHFGASETVDVKEINAGGIRFIDVLKGYHRAILIDAMRTKENVPGRIHHLTPDDINTTWNMISVHDMSLSTALALGALLDLPMPSQIDIWGIEGADLESFGETLTEHVAHAVPRVVAEIIERIESWIHAPD